MNLKERMLQLPEPVTDNKPPYWEYWRRELWRSATTQEAETFPRWPCVYHTMLVQHWPGAIDFERKKINLHRYYHTNGIDMVSHLSGALSFVSDDFLKIFERSSLTNNLIHQAYHLQQWEQATSYRVGDLQTIVEFGGGYGAMCALCHQLDFRGKYIIYDLPEFCLLQEYYLDGFGIKPIWNPRRKPKDIDLYMALYSISEVPPEERHVLDASSYLFLYSGQWEQWDNMAWFRDFADKSDKQWKHTELTHLPDRNNFYSIGWDK